MVREKEGLYNVNLKAYDIHLKWAALTLTLGKREGLEGLEKYVSERLKESKENVIRSRRPVLCNGGRFSKTITCCHVESRKRIQ